MGAAVKTHQVFADFFDQATLLRKVFDGKFADPLQTHRERFVWDYWHVPKEYTLLRTPAHAFFPRKLYENFHRHLVEWGRENLGCHDISPPWLSCYVEGCRQEQHSDVPHGPLAFVYSLTPWGGRTFTGGETFIRAREGESPLLVAPKFNRLVVFNPAIPHGVTQVRGTHDPREGRLVVHGWFVNPRPFWYGPLNAREISQGVEKGLRPALAGELQLGHGLLSVLLSIAPNGTVKRLRTLVSTLADSAPRDVRRLLKLLSALQFKAKRAGTELTLPLLME